MLCNTTMWALLGYALGTARNVAPAGVMGETGKSAMKEGYKVTRGEDNTQELNIKQGHPTKYKIVVPTLAEDLVLHQPKKYKIPAARELEHLDEGDFIKISFINREDIWLVVERVDQKMDSLIYAKVAQQVHQANELQKNQRVAVRREHVIEIKFHDEEDD